MKKILSKSELVISAAENVFVRYGFARTTMGDVAKAAGISRPALYLMFPDKEAIFSRVIEAMDMRSLSQIRKEVDELGTLKEKLLHACIVWGLHGMQLASAYPDAADLFDLEFVAVRQAYERFQLLLVQILDSSTTWDLSVSRAQLAETLTYGLRGLRYAAHDINHMRRLIEVHVSVYGLAVEATVV